MKQLRWVIILAAVLAGTWVLMTLSDSDKVYPSADSYKPSGMRALSDLLRMQGYNVVVSRSAMPLRSAKDVGIAVVIDGQKESDAFLENLPKMTEGGAKIFLLHLGSNFREDSETGMQPPETITLFDGRKVERSPVPIQALSASYEFESPISVALNGTTPAAVFLMSGEGRILEAAALPLTNRFLDKAQNAEFATALLRIIGKPGGKVIFCEAAFGEAVEPSLLDAFGGWAKAAWGQVLFLGLIVVYTLGKRFGYPDEAKYVETGGREMADAIAGTYSRGKFSTHALGLLVRDADWRIRKALKMSREAPRAERDRQIPADLAQILAEAETASKMGPHPKDVAKLAKRLDSILGSFLSRKRTDRRP